MGQSSERSQWWCHYPERWNFEQNDTPPQIWMWRVSESVSRLFNIRNCFESITGLICLLQFSTCFPFTLLKWNRFCSGSSDCAGSLRCFKRSGDSTEPVPGCLGTGVPGGGMCFCAISLLGFLLWLFQFTPHEPIPPCPYIMQITVTILGQGKQVIGQIQQIGSSSRCIGHRATFGRKPSMSPGIVSGAWTTTAHWVAIWSWISALIFLNLIFHLKIWVMAVSRFISFKTILSFALQASLTWHFKIVLRQIIVGHLDVAIFGMEINLNW